MDDVADSKRVADLAEQRRRGEPREQVIREKRFVYPRRTALRGAAETQPRTKYFEPKIRAQVGRRDRFAFQLRAQTKPFLFVRIAHQRARHLPCLATKFNLNHRLASVPLFRFANQSRDFTMPGAEQP